MKSFLLAALAFLLCSAALAAPDTKSQLSFTGKQQMDFPCALKSRLRIAVRSGEIRILPGTDDKISVQLSGKNVDKIQDLKAHFACSDASSELHITGGPKSGLTTTIYIPKSVDLYVRIGAGDASIEGISGSKDVELNAGNLSIVAGNPANYGHVDLSVNTGEIDATPFGKETGGLFRSVKKDGTGSYRLHAHVGSGQLTIR